jgi:hypothetical protein
MRKTIGLLAGLILLLMSGAVAQDPGANAGNTSTPTQIILPLLNPPTPVQSASVQLVGNPGRGTLYFWIVANFTIGNASPAGPFVLNNAPNTLSVSNYAQLSWQAAPGAASYDVLLTTTATPPTGACACELTTGLSATTYNATTNTTGAYTVNTVDPNQYAITAQNVQLSSGVSAWEFVLPNGTIIGSLDTTGNLIVNSCSGCGGGGGAAALWPVNVKAADYSIVTADFSSASSNGKLLTLNSGSAHTFTLPNPAPSTNGACVVVSNIGGGGILTLNPNGLTIDQAAGNKTIGINTSYTVCSNGTNYYRFGHKAINASEVGPPTYAADTGAANAYVVNLSAPPANGLTANLTVSFLPAHNNTGSSTINISGLGVIPLTLPGGAALVGNDVATTAVATCQYNATSGNCELQYPLVSGHGTGTPGGAPGAFQYNNGGAFGGANLTQDPGTGFLAATKGSYWAPISTATYNSGGTTTFDLSLSNFGQTTASGGNTTIAVSHAQIGQAHFRFIQDATGRTFTFPSSMSQFAVSPAPSSTTDCYADYDGTNFLNPVCISNAGYSAVPGGTIPGSCPSGQYCEAIDPTNLLRVAVNGAGATFAMVRTDAGGQCSGGTPAVGYYNTNGLPHCVAASGGSQYQWTSSPQVNNYNVTCATDFSSTTQVGSWIYSGSNLGSRTYTMPGSVCSSGACVRISNEGTGTVTVNPNGVNINGSGASFNLLQGQAVEACSNGTNLNGVFSPSFGALANLWSALNSPTGNLSLSMGSSTSLFTYGSATGSGTAMFRLLDTAGNTGTGPMLRVGVTSSSAAFPAEFDTPSCAWTINNDGSFGCSSGAVVTGAFGLTGITSGLTQTVTVADSTTGGTTTLPQGTYNAVGDAIANTYTALNDFSGGTVKEPQGAGATSSSSNNYVIDTTNDNIHLYNGSADTVAAVAATGFNPGTGTLAYWIKTGNIITLGNVSNWKSAGSNMKITETTAPGAPGASTQQPFAAAGQGLCDEDNNSNIYCPQNTGATFWQPEYNVATGAAGSTANNVTLWGFVMPITLTFSNIALEGSTADAGGLYSWGIVSKAGATVCHMTTALAMVGSHTKIDGPCSEGSVTLNAGVVYVFYYTGTATTGQVYQANNNSFYAYYNDATNTSASGLPSSFPLTIPALGPRNGAIGMPGFVLH